MSDQDDIAELLKRIDEALAEPLQARNIKAVPGAGGKKFDSISWAYAVERLNSIFGFTGWTSKVIERRINSEIISKDGDKEQWRAWGSVLARVSLHPRGVPLCEMDGIGVHTATAPSIAMAEGMAEKSAESKALRRAVRRLGPSLGLALYIPDAKARGLIVLGERREIADEPMAKCRSCDAPIKFVKTEAGKRSPQNPDGTSHFASCPQGERWSKGERPTPRDGRVMTREPSSGVTNWLPAPIVSALKNTQDDGAPLPEWLLRRVYRAYAWSVCVEVDSRLVPTSDRTKAIAALVCERQGIAIADLMRASKAALRVWVEGAAAELGRGDWSALLPRLPANAPQRPHPDWKMMEEAEAACSSSVGADVQPEGPAMFCIVGARSDHAVTGGPYEVRISLLVPSVGRKYEAVYRLDGSEAAERKGYAIIASLKAGSDLRPSDLIDVPALLVGKQGMAVFVGAAVESWVPWGKDTADAR